MLIHLVLAKLEGETVAVSPDCENFVEYKRYLVLVEPSILCCMRKPES